LITIAISDEHGLTQEVGDYLSVGSDYSVRFNGASRVGPPKVLPVGFQNSRASLIGRGVVLDLQDLKEDLEGHSKHPVYIDRQTPLYLPFHAPDDDMEISVRKDVLDGVAILASDLLKPSIEKCRAWAQKHYPEQTPRAENAVFDYISELSHEWAPKVCSVSDALQYAFMSESPVYFEGRADAISVGRGVGVFIPPHARYIASARVSELSVLEDFLKVEGFISLLVPHPLPDTLTYEGEILGTFRVGQEEEYLRQLSELLAVPCHLL